MKVSKFTAVVLTLVLVFGVAGISSAFHVDVRCPEKVAPGGKLQVVMQVDNDSGSNVYVRSLGKAIIGNPTGNAGFPVIYGPWNTSAKIDFPAGLNNSYSVIITDSVNPDLDGTIVMATIILIDDNGWSVGGGACAVAVE